MCDFQCLAALNQNTVFCPQTSSYHNRCRGGQTKGTGAGDHQYRYKDTKDKCRRMPCNCPDNCRNDRNCQYCRYKISCYRIRQFGNRCLPALCIFHQFDDFCKHRITAYSGYLHLHRTIIVHTSADHLITSFFFHRNTLPGQHRLIHTGCPLPYYTVQRNLRTGTNQNQVSCVNLFYRNFPLFSILQQNRHIRSQFHQFSDRLRSLALAAALQIFPQHHKCNDNRR